MIKLLFNYNNYKLIAINKLVGNLRELIIALYQNSNFGVNFVVVWLKITAEVVKNRWLLLVNVLHLFQPFQSSSSKKIDGKRTTKTDEKFCPEIGYYDIFLSYKKNFEVIL